MAFALFPLGKLLPPLPNPPLPLMDPPRLPTGNPPPLFPPGAPPPRFPIIGPPPRTFLACNVGPVFRSSTTTWPWATLIGLALMAFCKLSGSAKSTYAKPFFLSISTLLIVPKTAKASSSRGSVIPCDGFACLRNACVAVEGGAAGLERGGPVLEG